MAAASSPTAADYAKLLERVRDRPDFELLQTVLLRSLSQAQYRPDNEGHFGLAYEAYAHFTSPIRRYPDLLVHRAIKAALADKQYTPSGMTWQQLGVHTSMTERRADDASRDVANWLKCYLHAGPDRRGLRRHDQRRHELRRVRDARRAQRSTVSSTSPSSAATTSTSTRPARKLIGERSGVTFQLAGRLRVVVARVDLEQAKIDFTLAEESATDTAAPSGRPVYAEPLSRDSRPPRGKARR